MKTKILTLLLVQFMALSAFAGNVITYTASEKLPETTSKWSSGLHTYAFNVAILSHTFSNGTGTITFGGDVTSIGYYAFYSCSGLTSITIPNSVTSIGEGAFWGCSGLTSITIPNSVTSIGEEALRDCSGLTSIVVESGNTNYDSRDNCNAIIKTSTNTLIAGCKNTVIPNSVTSIGEDAFHECSGLTSITIPNSVTRIGTQAFWGCSGLTSITIPNSVTSIGDGAFMYCSGLTSITIPNSVTSIGIYAFEGCSGLTSIVVESGNTNYDSRDNCNAIIKTSTNTLIAGCQNTVIPNSVTSIGISAFDGWSGLTSITIPNSVTSIGQSAFEGCSGLTSITIPNSVTSIGYYAFYGCSGLTSITSEAVTPPSCGSSCFYDVDHSIPVYVPAASVGAYKTATEWMHFTNIQAIQATTQNTITYTATEKLTETTDTYSSGLHPNAFNVSITSHTFSDGIGTITFVGEVTSIGDRAFYGCSGLTSITIPNSVTSIGDWAFEGCFGLTSLTIPNSVTSIESAAFSSCSGLTSIVVESGNTNYDSRDNCNAIIKTSTNTLIAGCKNTVIPNSVTSIGEVAFAYCSGLTSITIPNSVTSIGNYAFHGCSGLTSLTIPNSVTSIGDLAFLGCSGLTSATIPNSVTSIGDLAFWGCSGLISIVVESGNTNYDSRDNCNAIIKTSTNTLIAGCKNTVIPNSVTSIGEAAFRDCSGLTYITIPNSVTSIGQSAFDGCFGLTSITSEAVAPPSCGGSYCFYDVDHSIPVYVPAASVGTYKTAAEWKDFTNIQAIQATTQNTITYTATEKLTETTDANTSGLHPNAFNVSITSHTFSNSTGTITFAGEVKSIGDCAFRDCSGLTSITIPNSVTSIGSSAFEGCSGLTSITIPNSVTSIGIAAFWCCSGLTSVTIPNSVTSIGVKAFRGCSGLTSVTIPNSVTSIGDYTFYGCSGLTSITIPNSVTSIGDYAFWKCSGLTSITIPNSVTSIGTSAFYGCSGLTSITIPNSVTSIGDRAFYNCSGLTSITSEAVTPPSCGLYCFFYVDHSIPVYVPAASVGAYKTAAEWKDFTNIQAMPVSTCALTVLSSNETLGSVMGSGEFALDTTVTIAALCKMDIVFSGWSDGNTDNPRQVTLTSDSTITAYFKEIEEAEYTIEVSAYNPALGTATATEMVLVEAVPYSGCTFVCWSDGNAENPRYIPLTGNINLQAIFSGTPTSVAETTDKAQGVVRKVIVDGQLHIIRDEKIYTVEGVLVE